MNSGNVPNHLLVAARTGFLTSMATVRYPWQAITMTLNMDAKNIDLVDLGAAPMPTNDHRSLGDFVEKHLQVGVREWRLPVWISYNAVKDDQTGTLDRKVRSAGEKFQSAINKLVFQTLNAGDGTTYHTGYDGLAFFSASHIDAGGFYQTVQDNAKTLTLSLDNFETVSVAAEQFKDDQGDYTGYGFDQIVCHPSNRRIALQITGNKSAYDTANREDNPYAGMMKQPITSPWLDTTAWYLMSTNQEIKPMLLTMKEQPHLLHSEFNPNFPDGGRYIFHFYARYDVYYGDWRLAIQGNT